MMNFLKNKKWLILLGASAISTVPCFVSANTNIISNRYDISYAVKDIQKKNDKGSLKTYSVYWDVNKTAIHDGATEKLQQGSPFRIFLEKNKSEHLLGLLDNNSTNVYKNSGSTYMGITKYKKYFDADFLIPYIDNGKTFYTYVNSEEQGWYWKKDYSWDRYKNTPEQYRKFKFYIDYTYESSKDGSKLTINQIGIEFNYTNDIYALSVIQQKIPQQYNNFVDELKKVWINNTITVKTDTGGNIQTPLHKNAEKSLKDNFTYLNEEFKKVNDAIRSKLANKMNLPKDKIVELKMKIGSDGNSVDLYLTSPYGDEYIIYKNMRVNFQPSEYFKSLEVDARLTIDLGKWVDFETGTTALVDDKLIRVKDDKEIKCSNKKCYLGKYEVHTPLKISFKTLNENEVLKINGKRIDVLDRNFSEILKDNRKNANDDDREFYSDVEVTKIDDKEVAKTEENSHKKNEYKIEILSYDGKGNLEENLVKSYEKILVINSKSIQEDFKWYAWDPSKNHHQKVLISPYKIDADGKEIKDDKGNKIPNELYDPSIDINTGTKKQVIWVDTLGFEFIRHLKEMEEADELEDENNEIDDEEETEDEDDNSEEETNNHKYDNYIMSWYGSYDDENDINYYGYTHLPYDAKTLFKPNLEDNGFIAEAIVLGKGGLKSYIGDTKDVKIFKIFAEKDALAYENSYVDDEIKTSENNYISDSGLYLIAQNGKNTISNLKFVLIDANTNPQTLFTDNISNRFLIPFWNSKVGAEMYNFIAEKFRLKDEEIFALSYEDIMEYYKLFINAIYNNEKFNSYISISPRLKNFIPLTKEEFEKMFKENDVWKMDKIKDYFLDDFKGNSYVEINRVEFSNDNKAVLGLRLNSFNINHKLATKEFTIPLKVQGEDKEILQINWNSDFFDNTLKSTNSFEEFKNDISGNFNKWFIDFKHYDKLMHSISYDDTIMELGIYLNDEFKDKYTLAGSNSFVMNIKGKWDNKKNNNTYDIFKNYGDLVINLNGENDIEKIKNTIRDKVSKYFAPLKLNDDYHIVNLDAVARDRSVVELQFDGYKPSNVSNLELQAKKGKNGRRLIKVYNYASNILDKEVDLSKIKLTDIKIANADDSSMINELYEKINNQLAGYNIKIPRDLKMNISEAFLVNILKWRAYQKIVLSGKNALIHNETSINVTTDIDEANKTLLDLSQLNDMKEIELRENSMKSISDKVTNAIKTFLFESYAIIEDVDYKFDWTEINKTIRSIAISDGIKHIGSISIYPIENRSQGTKSFTFSNTTKDKIIDDLTDLIDLSKIPNWDAPQYQYNSMQALKIHLLKDIEAYLRKHNLQVYKDYTFDNEKINKVIREAVVGDGKIHQGTIYAYKVTNASYNEKKFNFSNITDKEVIDDLSNDLPSFNTENKAKSLSIIRGVSFLYSENDLDKLKNRFVVDLDNRLKNVFGFRYDVDYQLNAKELNDAIKSIMTNDGKIHSTNIKLYPLNDNKDEAYISLSNSTNKAITGKLTDEIHNENTEKSIAQKVLWFIGIPLALLGIGATALLSWFIYIRKYKNKVK
ncbi:Mbov_0399 family ICE element protein [Mycoplasma sp. Z1473D]